MGDVAALEANDRKRAAAGQETRPETWSRQRVVTAAAAKAGVGEGPPDRRRPTPAAAPPQPGGALPAPTRPETRAGQRWVDGAVPATARISEPPVRENAGSIPPTPSPRVSSQDYGITEEGETYVVYRPDRGYAPAGDADREAARASQTSANVARTANAVRDVAVAAGSITRAYQDKQRT